MKRRSETYPSHTNPERWVLEQAHNERNPIKAASVRLDKSVRQLQSYGEQMTDIPDLSSEIDRIKKEATATIDAHYLGSTGTWTDIYRLIAQRDLLEQSIYAPLLFRFGADASPDIQAGREALANGILGIHANILAAALKEYVHPDAADNEKDGLRGVINEHTAMALLNYNQDPSSIALPATTASDVMAKTDVIRYTVADAGYQTLPIQVKSWHPPDPAAVTPEGGILVTGAMMGNSIENRLRTARAIVAAVENDESEVRSSHDEHLALFKEHFANTVVQAVSELDQQPNVIRRLNAA